MHELAIVQQVLAIVEEASGGARVRRVVLEIGKLSAVLPDAVRFCFDLACAGTVAEGAELVIVEVQGEGRCRACGSVVAMDRALTRCACGECDLEWMAGEELRVKEMEVLA